MSELKPCPFCSSDEIIAEDCSGGYRVYCGQCFAGSRITRLRESAITVWNKRDNTYSKAYCIDITDRCTNMSQCIIELETEKADLEKEVAENAALIESMAEECAKAQKKAADLKAENDRLRTSNSFERVRSLKCVISDLKARIAELETGDWYYTEDDEENTARNPEELFDACEFDDPYVMEVIGVKDAVCRKFVTLKATELKPNGKIKYADTVVLDTEEEALRVCENSIAALKTKEGV